jgi:pimeloyl-ACP methyl ester carboxylesterase
MVSEPVRIEIDVSSVAPAGATVEVGDLFLPDVRSDGAGTVDLVVCLPGGGMTRRYFDLPERLPGRWSMARHLADEFGLAVLVLDHIGVGDSPPPDDPYSLTPRVVAAVHAHVVAEVVSRLGDGEPVLGGGPLSVRRVIGLGHSMGAMLIVHQQARHRSYDALALLGFGGAGLPEHLDDDERGYAGDLDELELALPRLVAARFGAALVMPSGRGSADPTFLNPGVGPEPRALLGEATGALLALSGLTSMIPGVSDAALAGVDVPVFLGVGQRDIVGDVDRVARLLTSAPSITEVVVPGAGHNHVIADGREVLTDEVAAWILGLGDGPV